jgi:hypothetical protein
MCTTIRLETLLLLRNTDYTLRLSDDLCYIFGFTSGTVFELGWHQSIVQPDINKGISSLYVYSNVIEFRPVEEISTQLLRVVPIEKGSRFIDAHVKFSNVQYMLLPNIVTDLIDVLIRTDSGDPVPFTRGKVVLMVHFRPVS